MENSILFRKKIELEKNKETPLRIPVLFNPNRVAFCIEVSPEDLMDGFSIELVFKNTKNSLGEGSHIKVPLKISSVSNEFTFANLNLFKQENYLFYSLISDSKKIIHLSIKSI